MLTDRELSERLRRIFAEILPDPAVIDIKFKGEAALIQCSWLLAVDPQRPVQRSVPIQIAIERPIVAMLRADVELALRALEREMKSFAELYMREHGYCALQRLPAIGAPRPFNMQIRRADLESFKAGGPLI